MGLIFACLPVEVVGAVSWLRLQSVVAAAGALIGGGLTDCAAVVEALVVIDSPSFGPAVPLVRITRFVHDQI